MGLCVPVSASLASIYSNHVYENFKCAQLTDTPLLCAILSLFHRMRCIYVLCQRSAGHTL
jgi:hypothetical protein